MEYFLTFMLGGILVGVIARFVDGPTSGDDDAGEYMDAEEHPYEPLDIDGGLQQMKRNDWLEGNDVGYDPFTNRYY